LQALAEWEEKEAERREAFEAVGGGMEAAAATASAEDDEPRFVAYVPLPDVKQIE
jgi:hypothetical protein